MLLKWLSAISTLTLALAEMGKDVQTLLLWPVALRTGIYRLFRQRFPVIFCRREHATSLEQEHKDDHEYCGKSAGGSGLENSGSFYPTAKVRQPSS